MLETVQRIEPARLERPSEETVDTIATLSAASATLGRALKPQTANSLRALVRIMNSYYSNLIEGNHTLPRDIESALAVIRHSPAHRNETRPAEIERALSDGPDRDEGRRNLQLEAAAHVRVQEEVDRQALAGVLPEPASQDFVRWLHRAFYAGAAPELLVARGSGKTWKMIPGEWRSTSDQDVAVGRHTPPSSERVPDFMQYFAERYRTETMGRSTRIIAVAAAHHRFNYIHPFPDGNGRVSRLMSHALAYKAEIAAHGLWSVSRGLARGLESRTEYKRMMDYADTPRQGDLDGRGNLSEKALSDFVLWFLKTCVDQVTFMSSLFDLDSLADRLHSYVARKDNLKPESTRILDQVLLRGELDRGDVASITGLPERSARRVLADVLATGLLASDTPKGRLSLRFPADAAELLFPRLFLET
ncbi:MAG: Fic family protein [Devosia nanyangense]|uniref:Fic family protein n=1 Tax=Devosia nanyangense TaxID=1228055 RepID=A0A933L4U3_9HYPH|nr:Fic family protein [Devosia nanyangense]